MSSAEAERAEGQDPRVGQVLGERYRLVRRLEAHGAGVRYRAERTVGVGGGDVDVEISSAAAAPARGVERYLEDARTVARVGHDGAAQIFNGGRAPGESVFVAVEALEGTDLAARFAAEPPLPWDRAQALLAQLADVLSAHAKHGVVHGALEASSVRLVERDGRHDVVKLRDYGVARLRAGGDALDPRDDVRALGALAYRLVTGAAPDGAPPPPPTSLRPAGTLPVELDAVLARALDADVERRWPEVTALADALARCRLTRRQSVRVEALAAAERSGNRAASGAFEAATRRRRRFWNVASVAAAVVIAIVGLLAIKAGPGHVQITTTPADASLTFNGIAVPARSPVVLDASPGRYPLTVSRPGYVTVTRDVDVEARATTEIAVDLSPEPGAPPGAAPAAP